MTFELQRLNHIHPIILPLVLGTNKSKKSQNKLVGKSCTKAIIKEGLSSTENKTDLSIVFPYRTN